jgi:type IV pilus assembly protein PilC
MFVSVVRTGEAGGILDESMKRLAELLERRAEIQRRVIGAFIYPIITVLVEIAVMILIIVYALPKLMTAYPNQEELPAMTRGLLAFSGWFAANWWMLVLLLIALVVAAYALSSIRSVRYGFQKSVLYLPLFGKLNRKINVARFSRTLGNLTAAGIPLIDALGITAETADNDVVETTLYRVQSSVEAGGKMEEPMRREPVFDPVVVDMVMVGDEAGALDTMLLRIADSYDAEVDHSLKTMTAVIEPLLIVMLGFVVAFLAVAVFVPYVNLVHSSKLMPE